MKLIIAGGRDYHLTPDDYAFLDWIHANVPVTEVVSGMASGADTCGEMWAISEGLPVTSFYAMWKEYGKAAGPFRNRQMAEYVQGSGALVLFPGGRGTNNMHKTAQELGVPIFDRRHVCP
jgi:hypothetical protein